MTDETVLAPPAAATTAAPEISADAETTVQSGADSAPAKVDPIDPEFSSDIENVQKKFNKLTEHRRSAERELKEERARSAALMQLLERDRSEPAPKREVAEPVTDVAVKTLADFGYDETKYSAYLFEHVDQRAVAAAEKRLKTQQEQESQTRRKSAFAERETKFAKDIVDYHEVTRDPTLPITPVIAEAIEESEEGPALAYWLGKNRSIVEKLSQLSPLMAARELGRIEERLVAERKAAKAAKPAVSAAPPPAPKIEAVDPQVTKDPSQMTDAEFAKWRRRQIAQRR
jgi:phenylpyruvate tautomerase PptA (4-oxalocrotonate tautomerase family)